jgi:uncharacterized membrane protein
MNEFGKAYAENQFYCLSLEGIFTKKITLTQKRWLLILHILFSAIMLGNMVAFLIFSITIAASGDSSTTKACYHAMNILANTSVKASTIGATVTGILLSIWSKWGLFRYYWILVKEGLTLLSIGLNFWGMYRWTLEALTLKQENGTGEFFVVEAELWTGILLQIISLVIMYVISVFKPWGKRLETSY